MNVSTVLDTLATVSETISNPYIEQWKNEGKKVVAYTCLYMPEEILVSAGLLPYRLKGTGCTGTSRADAFLSTFNCSYCRACLELLMRGEYDFLDGAIFVDGCDHMHVTYVNWKAQGRTPFANNLISVPNSITGYGLNFYTRELENIIKKIEAHFEVEITSEKLTTAIRQCNETRRLQKALYALMAGDAPPLTGSQCLKVIVAGTTMPRDAYNSLLEQLIAEVEHKEGVTGFKHRLMISGSPVDDALLLSIIENTGGLVVSDTLCIGSRFFRDMIDETGDPLTAIVERYYNQLLCPRMFDSYDQRMAFVADTAKKSNVDGVILQSIKNCDCYGVDNVMLEKDLEARGIPVLLLEREYNPQPDTGRIKTRVQAFLERIS